MDVPIRINGEVTGKLEIMPEGNYTLFLGRCADPGRLLRLSVYGGGREGYIGVMMPEGGTVTVKKRFTRYDLRAFPATIEYAGEAGMAEKEPAPPEIAPPSPSREREPDCGAAAETAAACECSAAEEEAGETGEVGEAAEEGGGTEADGEPPGGGELLWYEAGDGTLYTRWEGRVYVAVPLAGHGLPIRNMLEQRRIEGTDYAIFAAE